MMPQAHPEKDFASEELLRNDSMNHEDEDDEASHPQQATGPLILCLLAVQGWNKRVRRGVWAASNFHNKSVVAHPKTYIAVSLLTLLLCAIGVPLRLLAEGGMMGDPDPLPAFLPNLTKPGWELEDKMYYEEKQEWGRFRLDQILITSDDPESTSMLQKDRLLAAYDVLDELYNGIFVLEGKYGPTEVTYGDVCFAPGGANGIDKCLSFHPFDYWSPQAGEDRLGAEPERSRIEIATQAEIYETVSNCSSFGVGDGWVPNSPEAAGFLNEGEVPDYAGVESKRCNSMIHRYFGDVPELGEEPVNDGFLGDFLSGLPMGGALVQRVIDAVLPEDGIDLGLGIEMPNTVLALDLPREAVVGGMTYCAWNEATNSCDQDPTLRNVSHVETIAIWFFVDVSPDKTALGTTAANGGDDDDEPYWNRVNGWETAFLAKAEEMDALDNGIRVYRKIDSSMQDEIVGYVENDTIYMYAAIGGLVILNGILCMVLEKPIGGKRITTGICAWSSLGMSMMGMFGVGGWIITFGIDMNFAGDAQMFFLLITIAAHHRLLYIAAFRESYDDAPGTQDERLEAAVGAMNNEAAIYWASMGVAMVIIGASTEIKGMLQMYCAAGAGIIIDYIVVYCYLAATLVEAYKLGEPDDEITKNLRLHKHVQRGTPSAAEGLESGAAPASAASSPQGEFMNDGEPSSPWSPGRVGGLRDGVRPTTELPLFRSYISKFYRMLFSASALVLLVVFVALLAAYAAITAESYAGWQNWVPNPANNAVIPQASYVYDWQTLTDKYFSPTAQLNLDVPIKNVDYVHGCVSDSPTNDPFMPAPADCKETGSIKAGIVMLANALKVNKWFDQSELPRELALRDWFASFMGYVADTQRLLDVTDIAPEARCTSIDVRTPDGIVNCETLEHCTYGEGLMGPECTWKFTETCSSLNKDEVCGVHDEQTPVPACVTADLEFQQAQASCAAYTALPDVPNPPLCDAYQSLYDEQSAKCAAAMVPPAQLPECEAIQTSFADNAAVCAKLVSTPEFDKCEPYADDEAGCDAIEECTFSPESSFEIGETGFALKIGSKCSYTFSPHSEECAPLVDGMLNKECSNNPNCEWGGLANAVCLGISAVEVACEQTDPTDGCDWDVPSFDIPVLGELKIKALGKCSATAQKTECTESANCQWSATGNPTLISLISGIVGDGPLLSPTCTTAHSLQVDCAAEAGCRWDTANMQLLEPAFLERGQCVAEPGEASTGCDAQNECLWFTPTEPAGLLGSDEPRCLSVEEPEVQCSVDAECGWSSSLLGGGACGAHIQSAESTCEIAGCIWAAPGLLSGGGCESHDTRPEECAADTASGCAWAEGDGGLFGGGGQCVVEGSEDDAEVRCGANEECMWRGAFGSCTAAPYCEVTMDDYCEGVEGCDWDFYPAPGCWGKPLFALVQWGVLGGNMGNLADIKWNDVCLPECTPEQDPDSNAGVCCVQGDTTCCVLTEGAPSTVSVPMYTKMGGWSVEGTSADYQTNIAVPSDMHELTQNYGGVPAYAFAAPFPYFLMYKPAGDLMKDAVPVNLIVACITAFIFLEPVVAIMLCALVASITLFFTTYAIAAYDNDYNTITGPTVLAIVPIAFDMLFFAAYRFSVLLVRRSGSKAVPLHTRMAHTSYAALGLTNALSCIACVSIMALCDSPVLVTLQTTYCILVGASAVALVVFMVPFAGFYARFCGAVGLIRAPTKGSDHNHDEGGATYVPPGMQSPYLHPRGNR